MRHRLLLPMFAALLLVSCSTSDSPVAPAPSAASSSHQLLQGLPISPITVAPLQRTTPLAAPVSASAYIGPMGGIINLPAAGLTVVVPALALTSKQLVTVTALAGSDVAYEFEPHGLKFPVPLVATQALGSTQVGAGLIDARALFVGYFTDATQDNLISEVLSVGVSAGAAVFPIWHFSGYIVASGRQ